jgi:hypothetical protein
MLLWIIVYATVFSLALTWGLVWILERKERTYHQGAVMFTDAFLAGSLFLIIVYLTTIVALLRYPAAAALFYQVLLVTGLAGFGVYKETKYRAGAHGKWRRVHAEIRLMELHLKKDAANAAYHERLSELYEGLGRKREALESARMAAKLEPTVRNSWRVKHLEEVQ